MLLGALSLALIMTWVGMTFGVHCDFSYMAFYGRGPWENYGDRYLSAEVDVYEGRVEDFVYHYVKPQENGNRTGLRWLTLADAQGQGLNVTGSQPLSIAVWSWLAENLDSGQHIPTP
jgi:beta-galactosidase